jgi:hypothetical protein
MCWGDGTAVKGRRELAGGDGTGERPARRRCEQSGRCHQGAAEYSATGWPTRGTANKFGSANAACGVSCRVVSLVVSCRYLVVDGAKGDMVCCCG